MTAPPPVGQGEGPFHVGSESPGSTRREGCPGQLLVFLADHGVIIGVRHSPM